MSRLVLLFITLSVSLLAQKGEWSFAPLTPTASSIKHYFDEQGAPEVFVDIQCRNNESGTCTSVVKNDRLTTLRSYGANAFLTPLAKGRYKDEAFLFYSVSYPKHTSYHLIDQNGKSYPCAAIPQNVFDALVARDGSIVFVTPRGIYRDATLVLKAPAPLEDAKLQNDLEGDIAAIARTAAGEVLTSNMKAWSVSKTALAQRGDKNGVLNVFPKNATALVYAFYKYVNVYDKGIVLGKVDFQNHHDTSGWLVNSQKRNVGFDVELFIDTHDKVHVVSKESTHDRWVELVVDYHDIDKLENVVPEHIRGFEEEDAFGFLVGTALSYMEWNARNRVQGANGVFDATLDYDIASSEFLSYSMQGRYKDTQLALSYLQNKAKEQNGIASQASRYFTGILDIGRVLPFSSALRLVMEKGKINAIATIKNPTGILNYNGSIGVTNEITRSSLLLLQERGFFYGLDYTAYQMPSLLGFGKSGDVKFAVFDPKTKIRKYTLEAGYDELAYAKRYETRLSRFYVQGLAGVGIGYIDYSNDVAALVNDKSRAMGYNGVHAPLTWVLDGSVDIGYIYQERAKFLRGLGFSWQTGIKARGTYYLSGSTSDDDDTALTLEYDRYDLWYGPYVSINVIF